MEKSEAAKRPTYAKSATAGKEEAILEFWKKERIFEKSLEKPAPKGEFVFYDGPPFATGLPHSGSLLSSVSKDLIPRYKTMRGYRVRRRWGWDTHGLPIESLVEKKLGLKNKKEILALGTEKFNETARSMVLEYVHDWKRYVERVGRWVDFDNSYKTMDNSFIESVWWGLKEIYKKGRLYEGKKVLMYCPHCETPLAKAEIAMDNTYKDITEEAITVEFRVTGETATSFLAWTTTPWTLPGNVALAVHPETSYVTIEKKDDGDGPLVRFILAKNRVEAIFGGQEFRVVREQKGSELVGAAYEPLYPVPKIAADSRSHKVYAADFVTTEEGTGIVHTAVMYGEDDFALGQKEKLPMVQLLNANATYNDDAPEFLRGEYIRKANAKIIEDLKGRQLLFASEQHTHSYPHCYRCGTPLIYNAVSSWFINIQAVKDRMLSENEKINWVPAHLKHGRFRNIIETAPDWTISRNRFWASPLPIWKTASGEVTVIGSLEELKRHTKKSGNAYFAMRHGESEHNREDVLDSTNERRWGLTEKGRAQAREGAEELRGAGITKIISSPFERTKQTAEIVAHTLGLDPGAIVYDPEMREYDFGELSGTSYQAFLMRRETMGFTDRVPGGGSYQDAKIRFGNFLYRLEREFANERILIVSHGVALESFQTILAGMDKRASMECVRECPMPAYGKPVPLAFVPLPHNRDFELEYHLPYIDEIQLENERGEPLTRIPEVVDCWVESGSMPFAEYHYPFENKSEFAERSPADFISEYIGQTRAWFYYLHAMGVELFDHAAFKHVITTGNILAADGAKVSKSKGNYTDPYELFDRYGADAFRYHLMSSVVMQAEDLAFRDEDVKDAHARVVNMLRNVLAFYQLFEDRSVTALHDSPRVLDQWIVARLNASIADITAAFDAYDVPTGTREMRAFVDDLSTWYVRRSRDRVKGTDEKDKTYALGTLRYILLEFSKMIAPVMPFIAEEIYRVVHSSGDVESVHLCAWPEVRQSWLDSFLGKGKDLLLISNMAKVRMFASEAMRLRQAAGIKVRQPLSKLTIGAADDFSERTQYIEEYKRLIKDEVNVKNVYLTKETSEVKLDTMLTAELIKEGDIRELMRAVAVARKEQGYSPHDGVELSISQDAGKLIGGESLPGISRLQYVGGILTRSVELSTGPVFFSIDHAA